MLQYVFLSKFALFLKCPFDNVLNDSGSPYDMQSPNLTAPSVPISVFTFDALHYWSSHNAIM